MNSKPVRSSWPVLVLAALSVGAAGSELPLVAGVKAGDARVIRSLLQQKADVNKAEADGTTALHWAVNRGDLETVDLLLAAGANPKAANRYGVTPLTLACTNGNPALVEKLLKAGADANAALPEGETPLMTAARSGSVDTVKLLLAHGADPRHQGEWGDTPLVRAVSGGALMDIDRPLLGGCHLETVRALLAHDPSLELPETAAGRRALWWARFNECDDVLTLVSRIDRKAEL